MSDLQLMDNMPDSYKSLLAKLQPENNLSGGGSGATSRRLSIRGGVFRKVINGKEIGELDARNLKVVIVKAAPISRMYYEGQYVAGEANPPKCWSADINTTRPSDDVLASDRQGSSCNECPQNIKGSGQGDSKACRFQQRIAVLLADVNGRIASKDIYMLSLPATSIFGSSGKQDKMSMKEYAQHLSAFKAPVSSLLTEMRFDTDSSTPKLCFKPARPLEEDELILTIDAQSSEEAERVVALTVGGKDKATSSDNGVGKLSLFGDNASPVEEKVSAPVEEDDAVEEVSEPTLKVQKKKAEPPKDEEDIAGLLDEWDD
jgi:hypothetical protein